MTSAVNVIVSQHVRATSPQLQHLLCINNDSKHTFHGSFLAAMNFPPLPQPKLVLDLATTDGCKAELTWVVVIVYPPKTVTYLRNNQAVSWPGIEPATRKLQSPMS